MRGPVGAGKLTGTATTTTVLMRARTPDSLVPTASHLSLIVSGTWQPANQSTDAAADDGSNRSGSIVVALPAVTSGTKRPALVATKASHFSDADGGAGDFSYSVSWYNLTALPAGEVLTVQAVTRGGRFQGLVAKLEVVWIAPQRPWDWGSSLPAPSASPRTDAMLVSPPPSGAPGAPANRPADQSTTVISTREPIHLDPATLGAASLVNLTFFQLLNFSVPPAFNPASNRIELFTKGEWLADDGADAPLGIVGIAYNGSLLAYAVASHYSDAGGRSANFSFGTAFANVSLPPGATAELWAGMRAGHFRSLSASASLTWSSPPAVPAAAAAAVAGAAPPAPASTDIAAAPAIEQSASISMDAPRTFTPAPVQPTATSAAAKPGMAPILNFTAPPNFNAEENMVEMWLTGQWDNATADTGGAPRAAAPPIGGVALMRRGKVLAYTFPSDEATAKGGKFFYGAVWKNVGLPADGGVVEVWAGMQGGTFKGLTVNLTLHWTPGDKSGAPLEPSAQPVFGNPLGGDGPITAQPLPASGSQALAASESPAPADGIVNAASAPEPASADAPAKPARAHRRILRR
jgi:hypothetical protein